MRIQYPVRRVIVGSPIGLERCVLNPVHFATNSLRHERGDDWRAFFGPLVGRNETRMEAGLYAKRAGLGMDAL